jgi:hypothetical protein
MQIHVVIHQGWPEAAFYTDADAVAYVAGEQQKQRDKAKKAERTREEGSPYSIVEIKLT